jgi:hypothetical protein
MVTGNSGAGPGIRFDYDDNEVFFEEESYGICFGGGALAATLTPEGRL